MAKDEPTLRGFDKPAKHVSSKPRARSGDAGDPPSRPLPAAAVGRRGQLTPDARAAMKDRLAKRAGLGPEQRSRKP